ncbi:glycosyl hydrolase family 18 protein [Metallumcola ferriviriculae]|uniref:Glycosyl hydrolase family 18 protein n=1 Tax=Metallumcola ferriviriculae TaxID=3039180 RepID=A0AAU0ULK3_9FIRM|nr:glycosyl hydrolase family 18 protein [Desulfitibacteraceae bacterium MK1]
MELERKKRYYGPPWLFFFLSLVVLLSFGAGLYFYPAFIKQSFETKLHLILEDKDLGRDKADVINGDVYLPLAIIREHLDENIFWEEDTGTVVVTTKDRVVRMATKDLTARVNSQEVTLQAPVIERDGVPWVPVEFLAPLYRVDINYFSDTGRVVITRLDKRQDIGRVLKEIKLRTAWGFRNPWLKELEPGAVVTVFEVNAGYARVRTKGGLLGYIPADSIHDKRTIVPESQEEPGAAKLWHPEDKKINLTWEFVTGRNPDTTKIPQLTGVNVVSPTWFYLSDSRGNIANKASSSYVSWAHRQNYQVWALFSNDFDRERTHAVLTSAGKREQVIDQLLVYASLYQLNGINIDFENVYLKDRELLVQFVRELVPLAHQQGLVVSIDVTIKGGSANYSLFYDRKALGKAVDYVILMTYDEHWASSPKAGSVASLPWVEDGVRGLLEDVPQEKLVLGVPFYTRLWIEKEAEDGSLTVKSQALSMNAAERLLEEKGAEVTHDNAAGQHYASWQQGDIVYEIWLENEESMRQRASLVKKYGLAGIASWRRGFEKSSIWQVIDEELKRN